MIAGLSLCAPAHGGQAVLVVRPPALHETMQASVATSGRSVAGLTGSPPGLDLRDAELTLSGLKPSDETICVTIERSSGLYLGDFRIPNPRTGPTVRIRLVSAALRAARARAGEFAIRAQASSGVCGERDDILPVRWSGSGRPAALMVFVNSQDADLVQLLARSNGAPVDCGDIRRAVGKPGMSRRSYDLACAIAPPQCGAVETIGLFRRYGLSIRPREDFRLRGWC